jgi:hypothetical protein
MVRHKELEMNVMKIGTGVLVGGLLLGLACGPMLQVRTDFDRAADFQRFRTFTIGEGRQVGKTATGMPNTLVKDRIDSALRSQLGAEGLVPASVAETPDLTVRYIAGARTKQELEGVGWGGPYWGSPYYTDDVWLREYPEGTLVVDLVDTRTGKLVWRASIVAEGEGFAKESFINKAVAKAFEKFPPRG